MASIFLDSSPFFEYFEDNSIKRTINHISNDNHKMATSISVLGEVVQVCLNKYDINRLEEIISGFDTSFNLEILIPTSVETEYPSETLECRKCIEDYFLNKNIYGSSASDRNHLSYAAAYRFDYFLTSGDETFALDLCEPDLCESDFCELEEEEKVKPVDIQGLRRELGYS